MRDRISVHHVAFPETDVRSLGRRLAATGTRRVSLWSGLIAEQGVAATRAMLDAHGLALETVPHVFRPGALSPVPADMTGDRARLSRAIADAAALGARSLYMLTGGRGAMTWAQAADVFAAAVAAGVIEARDAGVALSIETTTPLHVHLHLGTSLRDAIALAEQAGLALCLDLFGCWTDGGLDALIDRALPRICLVQVSDYVLGDTSLPCRAVPGDGAIPWAPVLKRLADGGYAGGFDIELLGPRIEAEGPEAALRRAMTWLEHGLTDAGFAPGSSR